MRRHCPTFRRVPAGQTKSPRGNAFHNAMKYQCLVCKYIYDEEKEGVKWHELPDDWKCPKCKAKKVSFVPMREGCSDDKPKLK